ncbi:MAG TPA: hypothetical protein VIM22_03475 [Solirubrobacteraceae bacterium]
MTDVLQRLAQLLRDEGGLIADAVVDSRITDAPRHGPLAASGPRAAADPDSYELLVESIREGYLLHYARGRVLAPAEPDLALLAGDQLYALGLARLAELGDTEAVGVLADVIALCAQAQAASASDLAEAVWDAGSVAVGWGTSPEFDRAAELARRGDPGAAEALRAAARPA